MDDFDFEEFCDWYGIDIKEDGDWYTTRVCPYSGIAHEQSQKTGIYWDGEYLGFHCFAAGCGNPSIGELIKKLNEDHEPYRGEIWPDKTDWSGIEFAGDEEDAPVDVIGQPSAQAPAQAPVKTQPAEEVDPLAFHEDSAYGWLGRKARELQAPMGWAYPTMLAIFAGQGINMYKTDTEVRGNLFVCLIADKGEGKSRTITRGTNSLTYKDPTNIKKGVPGSEHGLVLLFSPKKSKSPKDEEPIMELRAGLLVQDEFKATLNKVAIQGSCLPTTLCQAFYDDEITASAVKAGIKATLTRLSIVGGLKAADPQEFAETFGANTNAGLYDRFLFGVAPNSLW